MNIRRFFHRSQASQDHPWLFGCRVQRLLARGGGSAVYAVTSANDNRPYALKHVVHRGEADRPYLHQLENEYAVGRLAGGPGLRRSVNLRGNGPDLSHSTGAALLLEFRDGQALGALPRPTVSQAIEQLLQLTGALEALHELGFVHCDVNPGNILRDGDGRITLIDLGHAARIGQVRRRIQGTRGFIAPEQRYGGTLTPQTDLYAFGATARWLLRDPSPGGSANAELSLEDPDTPPAEVPELAELVGECLMEDPAAHRHRSPRQHHHPRLR
jgi:eukaryotic-like serine/threonine-protein kinase